MTISEGASLLTFMEAPVVVGDPEGRAIYVNPCFEQRFSVSAQKVLGEHLSALFSGGAREAMLDGVARVCDNGQSVRFRLREGSDGFLALVSAIRNEDDFLGVVILLTDEPLADERLLTFHREMQEPLGEIEGCLEQILEQTGGRRAERFRGAVEQSLAALERVKGWSGELHRLLMGRGNEPRKNVSLDPVKLVRQVAGRVGAELGKSGADLDLLVPAQLEPARGDGGRLEAALVHLLRERITRSGAGDVFTLCSRRLGEGRTGSVLISLVGPEGEEPDELAEAVPRLLRETVEELGGRLHATQDFEIGRVTSIELPLAPEL